MKAAHLRRLVAPMLGSLMAGLGGCTIGTPWPSVVPADAAQGRETVVLVLTRVVVDTQHRREFTRQNSRVLASMSSQPGLIGFAARRELFGDQGWTMSIWVNDEARAAFVHSDVHRDAIRLSLPALRAVELERQTVARKDLPANWDEVLQLLAEPEGLRNYWE
jgi:heme-degrading monooxygenase HmoA